MATRDSKAETNGENGQNPCLQCACGVTSWFAGFIPSKETIDKISFAIYNPGKTLKELYTSASSLSHNRRFFYSNLIGAGFMLCAGLIVATSYYFGFGGNLDSAIGNFVAGGGAFYANNLAKNKEDRWWNEIKDSVEGDPRRNTVQKLIEQRANLRSAWVKLLCHGTQFVISAAALATTGFAWPVLTSLAMGGLALVAYLPDYARSLNIRGKLTKELNDITQAEGLKDLELDERLFLTENYQRNVLGSIEWIFGRETAMRVDAAVEGISSYAYDYGGKYLVNAWNAVKDGTQSSRDWLIKSTDYIPTLWTGGILTLRGGSSTYSAGKAVLQGDILSLLMVASGAFYSLGGLFKICTDMGVPESKAYETAQAEKAKEKPKPPTITPA